MTVLTAKYSTEDGHSVWDWMHHMSCQKCWIILATVRTLTRSNGPSSNQNSIDYFYCV